MATPITRVMKVVKVLKSAENIFANAVIPIDQAEVGVTQASIALSVDFNIIYEIKNVDGQDVEVAKEVTENLTPKEIYLCGLYAYRNYALAEHDKATAKAVNFKTINFAVSGLTEKAKEAMRIVWWCDNEIASTLVKLGKPVGSSKEMRGE